MKIFSPAVLDLSGCHRVTKSQVRKDTGNDLVQPLGAQKRMLRPGGRRGVTLLDSFLTAGPGWLPGVSRGQSRGVVPLTWKKQKGAWGLTRP